MSKSEILDRADRGALFEELHSHERNGSGSFLPCLSVVVTVRTVDGEVPVVQDQLPSGGIEHDVPRANVAML
jgi:hypothetical protein